MKYIRVFLIYYCLVTVQLVNHPVFGHFKKLPRELSEQLDNNWCEYKANHCKKYPLKEEKIRRAAWERNLLEIYEHNLRANAGHHSFTLRDNHIADLSTHEYNKRWVKLHASRKRRMLKNDIVGAVLDDPLKIPDAIDWRKKGFKTPVINQGDCGSCYAFSIISSIQGQIFKMTNKTIHLSAQQLVDCSTVNGNYGCSGGSLVNTLRYLERAGGIMEQESYPYTAQDGSCKYQPNLRVVNLSSWGVLRVHNERKLEATVAHIGPVAVSINASPITFQLYHKGIYDDQSCSSDYVNHAMLLVGYDKDSWILKNWWGKQWGEDGYMYLAKKNNLCGITNYVAFARIKHLPPDF